VHVGWIGLGRVGEPMVLQVLAGGHTVTAHSRRFAHHAAVEQAGGQLRSAIDEAVRDADLVGVNVFAGEQLRDALVDHGGLAAMRPGAVLVIHSTVPPGLVAELAALRPDVEVVDAGFSGTADDVRSGRGLTLMLGGSAAAVERAEPVLRCYSSTIAHVGASGAGMTLKVINNLLFAAHMNLGREALDAAVASGISPADAVAVLQHGSAASFALGIYQSGGDPATTYERVRPFMEKDVAIALDALPGLVGLRHASEQFVVPDAAT
jgi:3-hydroxyisobutyrate dehydrogenase